MPYVQQTDFDLLKARVVLLETQLGLQVPEATPGSIGGVIGGMDITPPVGVPEGGHTPEVIKDEGGAIVAPDGDDVLHRGHPG